MDTAAKAVIRTLPKLPQAQYSLQEQLEELRGAAIRLGLYDADDWIMATTFSDKHRNAF